MKIAVLTTSHAAMRDLSQLYKKWDASFRSRLALSVFNLEGTLSDEEWKRLKAKVKEAEFIIHDPHGTPAQTLSRIHDLCEGLEAQQVILGGNADGIQDLFRLGSLRYEDIAGSGQRGIRRLLPLGLI